MGGTLVEYYRREQFPEVLRQAIGEVEACVLWHGLPVPPAERLWENVQTENHESADLRVRPLEERLARIFELSHGPLDEMCRRFLRPVFALATVYPDALPTLERLRAFSRRIAIVSNTPWGSPPEPWREEVERLGLAERADVVLFCSDVGWRKPAAPVFHEALRRLGLTADECLFVGDDPRWDLAGARGVGMDAVLVDRGGARRSPGETWVSGLEELLGLV